MKKNEKAVVTAQENEVINVVEETASVEQTTEVVETPVVEEEKPKVTLESLKEELQKAAKEMAEKKAQMAEAMKKLKDEAKAMKELEKLQKEEIKKAEAETRAKNMTEALAKLGAESKVNMTEKIKTMLLEGKTLDEIVKETGWARKAISDRIWLIEKRLGIR